MAKKKRKSKKPYYEVLSPGELRKKELKSAGIDVIPSKKQRKKYKIKETALKGVKKIGKELQKTKFHENRYYMSGKKKKSMFDEKSMFGY